VLQTRACLTRYGVLPQRLEIEITESTLIENDERALAVLHELRLMGCRISLDDFGTGYASLSYLRRFPFDKIKIDQSFLRGATHREEGIAIIAGTCDLAHRLKLTIVAEGIETEEHREIVRAAGSHQGQGYLFDRPLTAAALMSRIAEEGMTPHGLRHSV
jgi:EAL domain-containing protein (putative c-di-GMP-specific phosphodiesterase class I)